MTAITTIATMTTIICVAVRMKSKRCPFKAIRSLYGVTLIKRLTERLQKSYHTDCVVWCTSTNNDDDILEELADFYNIPIVRGHELDVMSRFLIAAEQHNAEIIVRVTGDNPLTDPRLIDKMLYVHHRDKVDYTYTADAPRGVKPEIINVTALRRLHQRVDKNETEYMTNQLHELENKTNFKSGLGHEGLKLTVDTPDDLKRVQAIYDYYKGDPPLTGVIIEHMQQVETV